VSVTGPSIGTRTQVSLGMGGMRQSVSTTATWEVVASRVGRLTLGPPSVEAGGRRYTGNPVVVEVVPQGTLPTPPRRPSRFDPFGMFDPFGTSPFPPGLFGQEPPERQEEVPPVPEEYRLDQAPDPTAFLRAVAKPRRVVVGEQVTLKIYAYGGRGQFNAGNPKEASRPDFLSFDLDDPSSNQVWVRVPIGDTIFYAVKVADYALFPLHSGKLAIGPMSLTIEGGRYRSRTPIVRSSNALEIEVVEPPLAGRPPGYRIGDVGELSLGVEVTPRRAVAGDAVSVVAKLEGTGNIPSALVIPQKRGVDWLEPSVSSAVESKRGVVGGARTFTYVVKLKEPGKIDLGELTLPYFDPKRGAYAVARADLGSIEVEANPKSAAQAAATAGPAGAAAPRARKTLGAFERTPAPFTDDLRFWLLLLGAPVAVALAGAGLELGQRTKKMLAAARSGPERLAQEALRAAEATARTDQVAATAGAVERALFHAIEGATKIRGRGLLRSELAQQLGEAGLPESTRGRALELLDACENARFTGKSGDLPPRVLLEKARGVVSELARKRKAKS
jgi:hypothetical protein